MPALIIIAVILLTLPVYLIFPGHAKKKKKDAFYGRNIAHRGLFERDQSVPENSLPAFKHAVERGYGVELDVQLSKDGHVVVFHDDDLKRGCGVDARVDGLDLAELQSLKLFGTDEQIPLFTDVLGVLDSKVPVIVELKTGKRNKELCQKTLDILRRYNGEYCIESFDPFIVSCFRFHAKDIMRGQLTQLPRDFRDGGLGVPVRDILGNVLFNFLARPHFIAHRIGKKTPLVHLSEFFGAMKVAWTAHDKNAERDFDTVIFEHYLPDISYKR
jgi:glycerophosphoryl diester phosphodiesterase